MDFVISFASWAIAIGIIAVMIADSIVLVHAYHFGVLERLRERTGVIYDEGLHFKLPFIDEVIPVSFGLTEIPIEVSFTTKDKLQLELKGSLQYRADPEVKDEHGRNLFISMDEKIIKKGIDDMLSDILGGLGGVYGAEQFIEHRQALGELINEILQYDTPYHLRHEKDSKCGVAECKYKEKEKIGAGELIDFYDVHWETIKDEKADRKESATSSTVEKRYGIDVEVFALANVGFSTAVKAAFEKEKEAEARARAFEKKLEMARKVKDLGADAQTALNAADVSLTPEIAANKRVVSVEGQVGVLGGIFDSLSKR